MPGAWNKKRHTFYGLRVNLAPLRAEASPGNILSSPSFKPTLLPRNVIQQNVLHSRVHLPFILYRTMTSVVQRCPMVSIHDVTVQQ